ncbi:MAG: hypothetical protein LBL57_04900 [Tannerella sp.]|nr:hypothetical protein [Tannerella sp.]
MSITVKKQPDAYSFAGNPVPIELETDSDAIIQMDIITGGRTYPVSYYPYRESDGIYRVRADISDYLKFEPVSTLPQGEETITPLPDFSRHFQVKIHEGDEILPLEGLEGHVFYGGIGKRAIQSLAQAGMNMFSYRLAFYQTNFLFTTRTNGREITLSRAELYPFAFIHPGVPLTFVSGTGERLETAALAAGTAATMDIRKILEQFPPETSRIEVHYQGEYAFHFALRPETPAREQYVIRFRNSLGAFEALEVTGCATHAPEFSEEDIYETLTAFDFYEERRSRPEHRNTITVETGYRPRRDFPFILDMIASDETYFIHADGYTFRCHVTAEKFEYRNLMTEPTSVKLQIRETVRDRYVTPRTGFDLDRIFDEPYDEEFN